MRIAGPVLLGTIAAACATVGAPQVKDVRKPTDPPSGDWAVQKREDDGEVVYEYKERSSDRAMQFALKKLVLWYDGKFAREERAEYHKNGEVFEMDLSPVDPKSVSRGIWKIDGDVLLLCFSARGADRPTEFTAPKDSKRTLWTLKRKGKE